MCCGALSLWEAHFGSPRRAGGEGGVSADSAPSPGSCLAGLSQRERRRWTVTKWADKRKIAELANTTGISR